MKKVRKKCAAVLTAVMILSAVTGNEIQASGSAETTEKQLLQEAEELISDLELGDEEKEYLEEIKERLMNGELDSEEESLEAIEEAEEKFDYTFTENQKDTIVSLGVKVQELGLDSDEIAAMAEKLYEKYGSQIKESAEEAIQEKVIEPAKEAVKESAKSAVKGFFDEMKRSVTGFFGSLFGKK